MDELTPNIAALNKEAINAALECRWEEALELNKQITEFEPENIAALNRLAKSLFELGKYSQSKKTYQSVLTIDPYNPIAQRNLKLLATFKADASIPLTGENHEKQKMSATSFLQEPGVTKIVNLVKLAEPNKLSTLSAGMIVNLIPKTRCISISTLDNTYLGVLPDDISHQMIKLIKGGNKYTALIKSVKPNGLTILVRETFRARRFKNQPSFSTDTSLFSFPTDHITVPTDSLGEEVQESEESEV